MRTARSTTVTGGLHDKGKTLLNRNSPGQRPHWTETPWRETPLDGDPWTETPLDRDPAGQRPPGQRPPWTETPMDSDPLDRDPLDRDPAGQRPHWTETPPDRDPHGQRPSGQRPPWTETPLDGDPLDRDPAGQRPCWTETPLDRDPTGQRLPEQRPPGQRPLDRDAPWTETFPPPTLQTETLSLPVNRITDKCKNITFPQLHLQAVIIATTILSSRSGKGAWPFRPCYGLPF